MTLGIDIKSSQQNAEERIGGLAGIVIGGDYVAIWSGFKNSDFGDGLILVENRLSQGRSIFGR